MPPSVMRESLVHEYNDRRVGNRRCRGGARTERGERLHFGLFRLALSGKATHLLCRPPRASRVRPSVLISSNSMNERTRHLADAVAGRKRDSLSVRLEERERGACTLRLHTKEARWDLPILWVSILMKSVLERPRSIFGACTPAPDSRLGGRFGRWKRVGPSFQPGTRERFTL